MNGWRQGLLAASAAAVLSWTAGSGVAQAQFHHEHVADRQPPAGLCTLLSSDLVILPAAADAVTPDAADSPYLRVLDDRERRQLVIDVGPVDLPAHAMAAHAAEIVYQLAYVPRDAWVHGFRLELRDAAGRAVPRRVLHHIDTTRPAARDLFLPVAQRFVALGAETKSEILPAWLAGVPLRRGEPLLVSTMLHNNSDTSYTGVHVRLVLPYAPSRPLFEVAGFRLDVMFPTGPMEFDLPPGRTVRSWDGSPTVPARILGLSGHLHRYAEWIELRDLTAGRVLWRARPRTSRHGDITSMPVSFPRLGLGLKVYPTHRYRITASYLNPTDRTIREGGMAKVGGIFTPTAPLPVLVPQNALYQEDLRYLLSLRCGERGGQGMTEMLAHATHGE
jgi:hypothetical protein